MSEELPSRLADWGVAAVDAAPATEVRSAREAEDSRVCADMGSWTLWGERKREDGCGRVGGEQLYEASGSAVKARAGQASSSTPQTGIISTYTMRRTANSTTAAQLWVHGSLRARYQQTRAPENGR